MQFYNFLIGFTRLVTDNKFICEINRLLLCMFAHDNVQYQSVIIESYNLSSYLQLANGYNISIHLYKPDFILLNNTLLHPFQSKL